MAAVLTGGILVLLGVGLAVGGVWLAALGGSWFYLLAAIGFLVTGALLIKRHIAALWVYAAVVLVTLLWALWEVGLDWWALVPRCSLVVLIGLWLLTPWVTRALGTPASLRSPGSATARSFSSTFDWPTMAPLAAAVVVSAIVALVSLFTDPHDVQGQLPEAAANPSQDEGTPNDGLPEGIADGEWHAYGRTGYGQRYSPLDEITPENVDELEVAWTFNTGDVRGPGDPTETTYEVTPLKVDDTLYLCTPHSLVIALDADDGSEKWRFDPQSPQNINRQHQTCRGVSYHPGIGESDAPADENADADNETTTATADAAIDTNGEASESLCQRRIYMPTADARLFALDAESGRVCEGFGDNGAIDLSANMPNYRPGFYYSTSPPVVTQDLVIVGGAINDNVTTDNTSGVIRAYDVQSGELVWNWDPGNPEETDPIANDDFYHANGPNMWSTASVDEDLGMVYLPMGNQPPDQWGAERDTFTERFSSSIVALDLADGQVVWVFQTVHHDLWDYDVPSQPSLIDLSMPEGKVPALVAPTKQGDLFVLNRETGEPILPVEEEDVSQSTQLPDIAHPTQPASALSLEPPPLDEKDMWGTTLFDQLACRIAFRKLDYEGRYTPPSTNGTLIYPGNFGVFNWGSIAIDPERQVAFTSPGYLAFVSRLIPRDDEDTVHVSVDAPGPGINENFGAPYAVELMPFMSPIDLPCQQPPWGMVAGADLRTGDVVWQHRNGTVRDLAPLPLPFKMGVPDLGGPVMTAGGVAFMSGTLDYYVRAYDVTTGEQLWEDRLPAGGQATPMTYSNSHGQQMVLVVAGGHGSLGTKAGDAIIAYALPE
ncbi:glucose/quinate/shikimate family membrane-bound PQQ-dependent dehydrogenase [Halomonas sp. TRM85114]|uniref:glucose/quinate/shikimate family membrane-bound PQQ-dependent dehydrogenase n=1 Tax=Halomonas jincaotanensis TaxID=2810616 RepID=UPI001BD3EF18|nr:glucose/quinate/shikimate family membrane-bound PQQ-dependent dehydrogenase [Halomonas jincaotanensis]MBS9404612.1 glucose/quinate/shikimate family membrane-bound PQQ-dependent dehydrogenase [Halomonas jincaotanensis]